MVVCGREFPDEIIERIRVLVRSDPSLTRSALSRQVCDWTGWVDPKGRVRAMSCRVALGRLHTKGILTLPPSLTVIPKRAPLPLEEAPLSMSLHDLGTIEVVPVEKDTSCLWDRIMMHHYLGPGPLCGAQIRYLIRSPKGILGGLSASAPAWRVAARDHLIGWTDVTRRESLTKVICNSRFLILPWVKVPHLASRVLSLWGKRIGHDWQERYGYTPLLMETYVDNRFRGTSYKAANWRYAGKTKGRGRNDRDHSCDAGVKDVYVYPLVKNALCKLRGPGRMHIPDWAEEEFGNTSLPDKRLKERLFTLARSFYARPQASIPGSCGRAGAKAAYRFFDHPEATMDTLLQSHYESTLKRARNETVVLAVQDTTTLNYNAHPATENLGPIGYHGLLGLLLHDTMAFTPGGTPLGLLDAQLWARDPHDKGKKKRRHEDPLEQKESAKWIRSFEKVSLMAQQCKGVTFVSVGDREADFYELFHLALDSPVKLLVRASHNRVLKGMHLWEKVEAQPVAGIQEIRIPRRGSEPARVARLEVRYTEVTISPSKWKRDLPDLTLRAILAREMNGPLEWMLLTTCEVTTFIQAVEKLAWYTARWGIEVYHRTLKSGCKIEERQLGHADRIEACLAIDMVVAWRIYHLTKSGRATPDLPCTVFFEEAEWKALAAFVTKNPLAPPAPPSLREATRMVASLGGFLGRKCDGEPGTKSLWIGLQRLDDITAMWKLLTGYTDPDPPVSGRGYG